MSTESSADAASGLSPPPGPMTSSARRDIFLAGGILLLAALAAYHNSFFGPFIMDDESAIAGNPTLRHLASAWFPPHDTSAGGRPLLNFTFALNYALGGMNVWGYHASNLLVHALAGLTLFGVVRRTLLRPAVAGLRRAGPATLNPGTISQGLSSAEATPLALAIAVIWVVHPLQTEAVTYLSQRAESLMGLFYLLTLYCFIRGAESAETRGQRPETRDQRVESGSLLNSALQPFSFSVFSWRLASVFCCLLGAATKETIATAPLMVFLYDRTFAAGSFREAWRRHGRYYLGLAGAWLVLFAHLRLGLHQQEVGFDQGITWWSYALTSCRSVVLYFKLAVWPHPLVFDYGTAVIPHPLQALPYVLALVVFAAGLVMALRRRPVIGFAGAWFLMILAPTSSVVPIAGQPIAEHRMYLSLAAVVGGLVLGLHRWIGRRSLVLLAALAVGLGWLSVQRNEDYRSALAIWSDTAAKQPDNARAHFNLGMALAKIPGRLPDAISHFEAAVRLKPDFTEAQSNLGIALAKIPGRLPDAISHFEAAVRLKPDFAETRNNLGVALSNIPGRLPDAISQFEAALRFKPDSAEIHFNLGNALAAIPGRLPEAIAQFWAALKLKPDYADAQNCLGICLARSGQIAESIPHFEAALQIDPGFAGAQVNLGRALAYLGRSEEAAQHFRAALKLDPYLRQARQQLELLEQHP